jgi:hypothetical protein
MDTQFIDEQIRIADSYPHDEKWEAAIKVIGLYHGGHCAADGRAVE